MVEDIASKREAIRTRIETDQLLSCEQLALYAGVDRKTVRRLKLPFVPGTRKFFPSDLRHWIWAKNGLTKGAPEYVRRVGEAVKAANGEAWPAPRDLVAALVKANTALRDRLAQLERP
jgi:hypothetical protein